jgi:glycosyltransferase involved in cell wall biosynthesis
MPAIDVIMPTYNHAMFLDRAISHIISQDFSDFSLIVVNDGSSDGTNEILETWSKRDNRISVIHNEINKKLPCSLNIGHAFGKSPYCTWVSDDNISYKHYLNSLYQCIISKDYDFVQGNYVVIDKGVKSYKNTSTMHDNWGMGNLSPTFLYKRMVWETYKYDENLPCVEDLKFYLQSYLHPFKFGHVNECLVEYYIHGASMTTGVHSNALTLEEHNKKIQKIYEEVIKPHQNEMK